MLQISNIRSSYLPSGIYHDSNDKQERAYTNCKFHDPRGRDSCARTWSYREKCIIFFLKIFISTPKHKLAKLRV